MKLCEVSSIRRGGGRWWDIVGILALFLLFLSIAFFIDKSSEKSVASLQVESDKERSY